MFDREIIEVKRAGDGTPSVVAVGQVMDMLQDYTADHDVVVISDENVAKAHPFLLELYPKKIILPSGEKHKSFALVETIYHQLLEMGADRTTLLVGIGGGVVTDITGFVASTYMRGIRFGFVPTTLLSQVDASVGGKNGLNLGGYKNIVGTFNQPDFVLCDLSLIKSLPRREILSGMAETLKCGIIGDRELFTILKTNNPEQIIENRSLLQELIIRSIRLKSKIVGMDEREENMRKLLNLGHTFGHAIEQNSKEYLHGEAVSIGISIAAQLSVPLLNLPLGEKAEIMAVIQKLGLPTSTEIPWEQIIKSALKDKKRGGEKIDLILIESIGECRITSLTIEEFKNLKIR